MIWTVDDLLAGLAIYCFFRGARLMVRGFMEEE